MFTPPHPAYKRLFQQPSEEVLRRQHPELTQAQVADLCAQHAAEWQEMLDAEDAHIVEEIKQAALRVASRVTRDLRAAKP